MVSENICYKYALIPYPTGQTFDDQIVLTNEDLKVVYDGYKDDEHETLEQLVEITIKNIKN